MDIREIVADTAACGQGRAPGLYDEQLQRQQQEKMLFSFGPKEEQSAPDPQRLRRALHI